MAPFASPCTFDSSTRYSAESRCCRSCFYRLSGCRAVCQFLTRDDCTAPKRRKTVTDDLGNEWVTFCEFGDLRQQSRLFC